jgi:hypothetical protein
MADCTAIVASLARPPVPPEWLDATVRSSLKFATHSATAAATIVSTRSVAIARRVLQTMLITKLSYIGAAGLGIVLAFGGVRTLAFQAPGEARSVRSASAAAQKSGDQGVAQVPPTPASPSSDDRNRQLASSVLAIGDDLDRAMRQLAELQDRLRKLEAELAPVRPGRPAPAPAAPRPPAAPAREDNKPEDSDKPYYVNLGRLILVISPDGSWAGRYDIQAGKPQPLNLPALRGDRREFIVMSDDMSKNPHPLGRNRISGVAMESVNHPWFLALDLDGGRKVTRITAFHAIDGTWIDQEITEPVARSAVRMFPGGVLVLGRRIYALSIPAKRWGILESPPGTETIPSYQGHAYWAERRGRLFRFNPATGSWDDIYARALQAEGKFDTGFAPAQ